MQAHDKPQKWSESLANSLHWRALRTHKHCTISIRCWGFQENSRSFSILIFELERGQKSRISVYETIILCRTASAFDEPNEIPHIVQWTYTSINVEWEEVMRYVVWSGCENRHVENESISVVVSSCKLYQRIIIERELWTTKSQHAKSRKWFDDEEENIQKIRLNNIRLGIMNILNLLDDNF